MRRQLNIGNGVDSGQSAFAVNNILAAVLYERERDLIILNWTDLQRMRSGGR